MRECGTTMPPTSPPFATPPCFSPPPFKTGKYWEALRLTAADADHLPAGKNALAPTLDSDVTRKQDACWVDIKSRAMAAARVKHSRSASPSVDGQLSLKRFRAADSTSGAPTKSKWTVFSRSDVSADVEDNAKADESSDEQRLRAFVAGELERYKALLMSAEELDCRVVLSWWARSGGSMFPRLAPVAQQVFGSQASAAQKERDFNGCGNLLAPNRSRMDTYWVEMVMFLKANYEYIPALKQVPMISAKDIRTCLPVRFSGRDGDLLAAEVAFDVFTNTASPTTDDVDLDG